MGACLSHFRASAVYAAPPIRGAEDGKCGMVSGCALFGSSTDRRRNTRASLAGSSCCADDVARRHFERQRHRLDVEERREIVGRGLVLCERAQQRPGVAVLVRDGAIEDGHARADVAGDRNARRLARPAQRHAHRLAVGPAQLARLGLAVRDRVAADVERPADDLIAVHLAVAQHAEHRLDVDRGTGFRLLEIRGEEDAHRREVFDEAARFRERRILRRVDGDAAHHRLRRVEDAEEAAQIVRIRFELARARRSVGERIASREPLVEVLLDLFVARGHALDRDVRAARGELRRQLVRARREDAGVGLEAGRQTRAAAGGEVDLRHPFEDVVLEHRHRVARLLRVVVAEVVEDVLPAARLRRRARSLVCEEREKRMRVRARDVRDALARRVEIQRDFGGIGRAPRRGRRRRVAVPPLESALARTIRLLRIEQLVDFGEDAPRFRGHRQRHVALVVDEVQPREAVERGLDRLRRRGERRHVGAHRFLARVARRRRHHVLELLRLREQIHHLRAGAVACDLIDADAQVGGDEREGLLAESIVGLHDVGGLRERRRGPRQPRSGQQPHLHVPLRGRSGDELLSEEGFERGLEQQRVGRELHRRTSAVDGEDRAGERRGRAREPALVLAPRGRRVIAKAHRRGTAEEFGRLHVQQHAIEVASEAERRTEGPLHLRHRGRGLDLLHPRHELGEAAGLARGRPLHRGVADRAAQLAQPRVEEVLFEEAVVEAVRHLGGAEIRFVAEPRGVEARRNPRSAARGDRGCC